jgi:hypothetical protein
MIVRVFIPGDEKYQLATNFQAGEFKCKGGDWPWFVEPTLVEMLQLMRNRLGRALSINSAYRTPEYNAGINGATKSKHIIGAAADLATPDKMSSISLAGLAYAVGFRRIGVAHGFVHVDTAPGEAYWAYTGDLKKDLQSKIERASEAW